VHSLIFLCSAALFHRARDEEESSMSEYTGCGAQEPVLWFRQTIGHACGLMALLHCLANGEGRKSVPPGSELDTLFQNAVSLPPSPRASLLYDSQFIERAHMAAAVEGSSVVPSSADPVGFHYIAFVKDERRHLWELNGSMKGPVDRGVLGEEDLLSRKALDMSVAPFLAGGEDIGASVVALAG
jgi:ubiquitin carboxyl-terminal hydrolase L3